MGDALLWACFLAVVAGTAVAAGVVVRDLWRMLSARKHQVELSVDDGPDLPSLPDELQVTAAQVPDARAPEPDLALAGFRRRGLGAADVGVAARPVSRPPRGGGLGSYGLGGPRAPRSSSRGLGARPHEA